MPWISYKISLLLCKPEKNSRNPNLQSDLFRIDPIKFIKWRVCIFLSNLKFLSIKEGKIIKFWIIFSCETEFFSAFCNKVGNVILLFLFRMKKYLFLKEEPRHSMNVDKEVLKGQRFLFSLNETNQTVNSEEMCKIIVF